MAGSVVVATKRALVTLLKARPNLLTGSSNPDGKVQVSYGYPGDDLVESERIFTGRSRADQTQTALKAGRKFRAEASTFDVLIQVDKPNESIEDTEARAMELGVEVEEAIADDYTLGGVDGLNWAVVSGWTLDTFPTEHGHLTQLIYTVTYNARLT